MTSFKDVNKLMINFVELAVYNFCINKRLLFFLNLCFFEQMNYIIFSHFNEFPLSQEDKDYWVILIRKQMESTQDFNLRIGETFQTSNDKQIMSRGPQVHALQELLPPFNDLILTCWQASSSNPGLNIRRKTKIGCSRVNNTLLIKTSEPKKSDTKGTIGIITTRV